MISLIRSAIGSTASLGFIELLQSMGYRVIGTDIIDDAVGRFVTDSFYVVPKANHEEQVVDAYNTIAVKEEARWIISGPEQEVEVLIKHREKLKASVFHLPYATFKVLTDKLKLFLALEAIGLKTPRVFLANSSDYLKEKGNRFVLKPRKGRGSAGVYIVNKSEIESYLFFLKESIDQYIIQEYIEGEEISTDTLHDFEGNILNVVSRIRINTESGVSTVSRTIQDEEIFRIIQRLSRKHAFYGANCIQFIRKRASKEYFLTDVNPRFGGGSILSLKASRSMRENLVHLLDGHDAGLTHDNFECNTLTMVRGYREFYK